MFSAGTWLRTQQPGRRTFLLLQQGMGRMEQHGRVSHRMWRPASEGGSVDFVELQSALPAQPHWPDKLWVFCFITGGCGCPMRRCSTHLDQGLGFAYVWPV